MPLGRPLPQYACRPRPWRGSLPRPRPVAKLTLEVFMPLIPPRSQKSDYPRDRGSYFENYCEGGATSRGVAFGYPSADVLFGFRSNCINLEGKTFGRSRSCLTRLNRGEVIGKLFLTGAVDISRTLQASRIPS